MKTCKEGANLQIPYFESLVLTYLFYIRKLFSFSTRKEKKGKFGQNHGNLKPGDTEE